MESYRIALLGLGTVGGAVVELLAATRKECAVRAGRPIEVSRIVVRDPSKKRTVPADLPGHPTIRGDAIEAIEDPNIDAIVELAGGTEAPREWIRLAFEQGKDVITANKAVLAVHGDELFDLAKEHGRSLYYEASVAAAVPILQVIQQGIPAGPVDRLTGILNGTCNFILGRLEELSFEESVKSAQQAGLAEADPTLDISGMDSAHKLSLLARILLGCSVPIEKLRVEGIEGLSPHDIEFGWEHDLSLKLLGMMRRNSEGTALGVMPCFLPTSHPLASVREEDNAVLLEAAPFGSLVLQGKGAGGMPTAGSVVADILRAARGDAISYPASGTVEKITDPGATPVRHYLRLEVPDRHGVLARVAGALASEQVGIAALDQPENLLDFAGVVPIRILTHPVETTRLDLALSHLDEDLQSITKPVRIRIEE
ncbi:MAG: homoserine dehydrogenase [Planctomycetes bacterium]|jgi:homoserine dehydrogenase|nr:homoserine dehydrogenase [Planctomycetota bacterium]MBT6452390.1 homoserine dehydrogenase [Planctomycetota bacterium]MBT6541785.1 homoserine dehydrogenase [Planctomycetota bacterium]MBT6784347.1 homoserine dehydrogenase [Planctomycetota bacterium]MBT6968239.1 homoserine dehydrogenase [Planctomycetota bacterium]